MTLLYKGFYNVRSIYKSVESIIFSKLADSLRIYWNVKNTCGGVLFLVKLHAEIGSKSINLPGNEQILHQIYNKSYNKSITKFSKFYQIF